MQWIGDVNEHVQRAKCPLQEEPTIFVPESDFVIDQDVKAQMMI